MKLVGERKALAAIALAFFAVLFALNGLLGPSPFAPMFLGLAACYVVAFFSLVAGYFWGRWFATGLAFSGLMSAGLMAWQIGLSPIVWFWGGLHGIVALALTGRGPQSIFDGRADWRERYRMDEDAVVRLGKSVRRAGTSLPYLIMAGLAPRQSLDLVALCALALAVAGLWALVGTRAWALLALAGSALLAGSLATVSTYTFAAGVVAVPIASGAAALVATALLVGALLPFVRPALRFVFRAEP